MQYGGLKCFDGDFCVVDVFILSINDGASSIPYQEVVQVRTQVQRW